MRKAGIELISVFGMPPVAYVELARDLGCPHISTGLTPMDFNPHGYPPHSLRERATRAEMAAALRDCGVSISLGEGFLVQPGRDVRQTCGADLEAMAELGARRINSVSFEADFARNVDQLGRLAEMAATLGMETMLEFVPCFAVADLPTAHAIVHAVGRSDLRLLIDTMHVGRSGATPADLAAIDRALIGYVQLCDVPLRPRIADYLEEAKFERMVPGQGELPLREMLAALPRESPVGLEVPLRSQALAGAGPHERLSPCVAAATALLAGLD